MIKYELETTLAIVFLISTDLKEHHPKNNMSQWGLFIAPASRTKKAARQTENEIGCGETNMTDSKSGAEVGEDNGVAGTLEEFQA